MQGKHKLGNQSIRCSVGTCQYNGSNSACTLDGIQVDPIQGMNTGKPEDESMCASYRKTCK